ncbi:MAG: Hsp20 family protein [Parvularculaceae bacterium]|nr:MAG: Hsp20 family protein [Parvularculaceae bacterium]
MRNYDLTPLYRNTVGFDRMFDLLENIGKVEGSGGYPPYNIERLDEDEYRITLAVAGFSEDELEIVVHENTLTVAGVRPEGDEQRTFLHQGIAGRSFERRFQLADHVKIEGASLKNGLLNVALKREIPEAKKPRKISISADAIGKETLKPVNAA